MTYMTASSSLSVTIPLARHHTFPSFGECRRRPSISSHSNSNSSEWSDPVSLVHDDDQEALEALNNSSAGLDAEASFEENVEKGDPQGVGIDIPIFLQPFLGVEFLPFTPQPQAKEDRPTSDENRETHTNKQKDLSPKSVLQPSPQEETMPTTPSPPKKWILSAFGAARKRIFSTSSTSSLDPATVSTDASKHPKLQNIKETIAKRWPKLHPQQDPSKMALPPLTPPASTASTSFTAPMSSSSLHSSSNDMTVLRRQAKTARLRAQSLEERVVQAQQEVQQRHDEWQEATRALKQELQRLHQARDELEQVERDAVRALQQWGATDTADSSVPTVLRPRCHTAPALSESMAKTSGSDETLTSTCWVRVHDLDQLTTTTTTQEETLPASLAKSFPDHSFSGPMMSLVEDHVPLVLKGLAKMGLETVTDESEKFHATWDTQRLLKQCSEKTNDWPYTPWYQPPEQEVLVWTQDCPGHVWPLVKVRGVVPTSARQLVNFLLDSNQCKSYNKMSQGRDDVVVYQQGLDTNGSESGYPGEAKIQKAINKPKLSPKSIETVVLSYAQRLPNGAYLIVSRSVWEDPSKPAEQAVVRSEMILGVQLIRPLDTQVCELSTLTHMYSPGVPEIMAKRVAPGSAANLLREIQSVFRSLSSKQ